MFSVSPHYFQHIFHCYSNPWTHHFLRETCLDRMEIFCADLPFPGEQVRSQVYLILIVTPWSLLSPRGLTLKLFITLSQSFLPCLSLRNLSWLGHLGLGSTGLWWEHNSWYLQKIIISSSIRDKAVFLCSETIGKIIPDFKTLLTHQWGVFCFNTSEKLGFSPLIIKKLGNDKRSTWIF